MMVNFTSCILSNTGRPNFGEKTTADAAKLKSNFRGNNLTLAVNFTFLYTVTHPNELILVKKQQQMLQKTKNRVSAKGVDFGGQLYLVYAQELQESLSHTRRPDFGDQTTAEDAKYV